MKSTDHSFVSRGGIKLAAALDAFGMDVAGLVCADLGCNVGGFTDCLLQRGAAKVYAVDTGYGELAWKLRQDDRVVVMERTNALYLGEDADSKHDAAKPRAAGADLVVIDMGWTRQERAIPAALRWEPTRIITLIKPHYEASADVRKRGGILDEQTAESVARRTLERMPGFGVRVIGHIPSPIRGGKGKGKRGNVEYLALVEPA